MTSAALGAGAAAPPGRGTVDRGGGRGRVSGPDPPGSARAPRPCPREGGGRVLSRPRAQACAAEGQVRGRAEVSGDSGVGDALCSCRAPARASSVHPPGRKAAAPRPPDTLGSMLAGFRAEGAPRTLAVDLGGEPPGPGPGPGLARAALASGGPARGTGSRRQLPPLSPSAARSSLGVCRPGGNFLGHPPRSECLKPSDSTGSPGVKAAFLGWAGLLGSFGWVGGDGEVQEGREGKGFFFFFFW